MTYGELGVLESDGDKVRCHICGRWFGHLGCHVVRKHHVDADAYKREFGLNRNTGLIGPSLADKRREHMAPMIAAAGPNREAVRNGTIRPTKRVVTLEERRKMSARTREVMQRPHVLAARERMKGPRTPHGTTTRYGKYGCRCEPCRAARSAYKKEWRRKKKAMQ